MGLRIASYVLGGCLVKNKLYFIWFKTAIYVDLSYLIVSRFNSIEVEYAHIHKKI